MQKTVEYPQKIPQIFFRRLGIKNFEKICRISVKKSYFKPPILSIVKQ
jgi:hypothetical protein